jgi:hypothetical protein
MTSQENPYRSSELITSLDEARDLWGYACDDLCRRIADPGVPFGELLQRYGQFQELFPPYLLGLQEHPRLAEEQLRDYVKKTGVGLSVRECNDFMVGGGGVGRFLYCDSGCQGICSCGRANARQEQYLDAWMKRYQEYLIRDSNQVEGGPDPKSSRALTSLDKDQADLEKAFVARAAADMDQAVMHDAGYWREWKSRHKGEFLGESANYRLRLVTPPPTGNEYQVSVSTGNSEMRLSAGIHAMSQEAESVILINGQPAFMPHGLQGFCNRWGDQYLGEGVYAVPIGFIVGEEEGRRLTLGLVEGFLGTSELDPEGTIDFFVQGNHGAGWVGMINDMWGFDALEVLAEKDEEMRRKMAQIEND